MLLVVERASGVNRGGKVTPGTNGGKVNDPFSPNIGNTGTTGADGGGTTDPTSGFTMSSSL